MTITILTILLGVLAIILGILAFAEEISKKYNVKFVNKLVFKLVAFILISILLIWGNVIKDKYTTKELNLKLAHQDSISQKLVDSLTQSLSLTKEFKQSSSNMLNRLDTNLVNQSMNLNQQSYLMKKTSNLLLHPFFPIKMKITLKVKPQFNDSDKKIWSDIKFYLKKNFDSINELKDFSIETAEFSNDFSKGFSTENLLTFTSHDPYDKKITTDYTPQLNKLNKFLFNKILPGLIFYITNDKKTSKIDEYENSMYIFTAAYRMGQDYLPKQYQTLSNCTVEYYINLYSDEITFTYYTPINLSGSNSFNSLYDIPNGSFYLSINNILSEDVSLTEIIFSCGNKPETIPCSFNLQDLVYSNNLSYIYSKNISDILKLATGVK